MMRESLLYIVASAQNYSNNALWKISQMMMVVRFVMYIQYVHENTTKEEKKHVAVILDGFKLE